VLPITWYRAARIASGTVGILDLVQDSVPVPAIEPGEELPSLFVLLQLPAQVFRHRGGARRVVGGVPPAVGLGPLDLPQARWLQLAPLYELRGLLAVDLRPPAPRPSRREQLQIVVFVEPAYLAVDPAVA
jgi:hypothetical protein